MIRAFSKFSGLPARVFLVALVLVLFLSLSVPFAVSTANAASCSVTLTINLNPDKYLNTNDGLNPPSSIAAVERNNSGSPVFAVGYTCEGKTTKIEMSTQTIHLSVDAGSPVSIAGRDTTGSYPPQPQGKLHNAAVQSVLVLDRNAKGTGFTAPSSGGETVNFTYYEYLPNGASYIVTGNGGGYSAPVITFWEAPIGPGSQDSPSQAHRVIASVTRGGTLLNMLNAHWYISQFLPGSNKTTCWVVNIQKGSSLFQLPTYFNYTEQSGASCANA